MGLEPFCLAIGSKYVFTILDFYYMGIVPMILIGLNRKKGVILEFVCNNYFPINGKIKHVLLPELHSVECEHKSN